MKKDNIRVKITAINYKKKINIISTKQLPDWWIEEMCSTCENIYKIKDIATIKGILYIYHNDGPLFQGNAECKKCYKNKLQ